MITKKTAFRSASVVSVLVLVGASCIPESQQATGWGTYPGEARLNDTGFSPGVFVLGDSLIYGNGLANSPDPGSGLQEIANSVREVTGAGTVVAAAGGASLSHYMKSGLKPAEMFTLAQYEAFYKPRITVFALGSNDARIMTTTQGQQWDAYTIEDYRGSLKTSISLALNNGNGKCVILVNAADHWKDASSASVAAVNAEIDAAVASNPAQVLKVDWATASKGQPWFVADDDIHHNADGKKIYRYFIVMAIDAALKNGC